MSPVQTLFFGICIESGVEEKKQSVDFCQFPESPPEIAAKTSIATRIAESISPDGTRRAVLRGAALAVTGIIVATVHPEIGLPMTFFGDAHAYWAKVRFRNAFNKRSLFSDG